MKIKLSSSISGCPRHLLETPLLLVSYYILIINKRGVYAVKVKKQRGFCVFPGYKYCGPGCSGPGDPINDVDACCKAHDECLKVDTQCNCDRKFLLCLRRKMKLTSRKGRIATLMYLYMRIQTIFTCFKRN